MREDLCRNSNKLLRYLFTLRSTFHSKKKNSRRVAWIKGKPHTLIVSKKWFNLFIFKIQPNLTIIQHTPAQGISKLYAHHCACYSTTNNK
jgi:hypothetical protein